MPLLPLIYRLRAKMGTREDLRPRAREPRSKLPSLPCRTLPRTGRKLLGKTRNGTGNCQNQRLRRLASAISWMENPKMVSIRHAERSGSGIVTEELGRSIKCCEVALSSASARTWGGKIKNAQKVHDTALSCIVSGSLGTKLTASINVSFI